MTAVRSNTAAETTPRERRSLVGPWADFWLLGGASIAFCLLFAIAEPLRDVFPAFEGGLLEIAAAGFLLSIVVNWPHFLASYRLAYTREREFIQSHRFELVIVPALIVVAALVGIISAVSVIDLPGDDHALLAGIAVATALTVGWHYVKQIYGCVRITSAFDNYTMPNWQMNTIRYGLFPLWARGLIVVGDAGKEFADLDYPWLSSPQILRDVVNVGVAIGAIAIVASFVANYRETSQLPTMRMIVPILAIYAWWVPAARFGFPLPLVPFFHSLQYLPFVAKVERSKAQDKPEQGRTGRQIAGIYTFLVILGFLVFYLLPATADVVVGSEGRSGIFAITIAVSLGINLHHYFIDHVLWRMRDDPHMRDLLLR